MVKKFCLFSVIVFISITLIGCRDEVVMFDAQLLLEITVEDGVEIEENTSFWFFGIVDSQTPTVGAYYSIIDIGIGETEFSLPIRTAISGGEIVEMRVYQITPEMVAANREGEGSRFYPVEEWVVSDEGWLIDAGVFYLTFERIVESDRERLELSIMRYENGNYVEADEIRFVNHYLGS